jgi:hypothetical protein
MEDSVKLTDTQRRLLAAASQRDNRALERPPNLNGGVAGKVVAKLLAEDLVEEVQSRRSLPVWRRRPTGRLFVRLLAIATTAPAPQAAELTDRPTAS